MSGVGDVLLPLRGSDDEPAPRPLLRIVCSWCGLVMREGEPGAETSHGMCPECLARMRARTAAARVVVSGRQR